MDIHLNMSEGQFYFPSKNKFILIDSWNVLGCQGH